MCGIQLKTQLWGEDFLNIIEDRCAKYLSTCLVSLCGVQNFPLSVQSIPHLCRVSLICVEYPFWYAPISRNGGGGKSVRMPVGLEGENYCIMLVGWINQYSQQSLLISIATPLFASRSCCVLILWSVERSPPTPELLFFIFHVSAREDLNRGHPAEKL